MPASDSNINTSLSILYGNGSGGFGAPSIVTMGVDDNPIFGVQLGDINGDGNLDLVPLSAGELSMRFGNGDGTFGAETSIATGVAGDSIALADLNNDGRDEVAFMSGTILTVFDSVSASTTSSAIGVVLESLVAGDFDGDGNLDLAGSNGANVYVSLGAGDKTIGAAQINSAGAAIASIAAADIDSDGRTDVVAFNGSGATSLFAEGDGSLTIQAVYTGAASVESGAVGDLNADGVLDLAFNARVFPSPQTQLAFGNSTLRLVAMNVSINTAVDARRALDELRDVRDSLAADLGTVGAELNRIAVRAELLRTRSLELTSASARIKDLDVAEEAADLTRASIPEQSRSVRPLRRRAAAGSRDTAPPLLSAAR